jgi:osmoprotectant transport system substrate-binding protein
MMPTTRVVMAGIVLGLAASSCGGPASTPKAAPGPHVTIGSAVGTVPVIVAHLYAGVLRRAGATVTLRAGQGTRESVQTDLVTRGIDLYPDDAGALLTFLDSNDAQVATRTSTAVPALEGLLGVVGATVLAPAPALDTRVFMVTGATATTDHLTTLSSLAPVASQLVLGGPPGCTQQPRCVVGLEGTYGLHFKSFTSLDDAGPVTVSALQGGEVQIAELSSTDGTLVGAGFVTLTDDRHLLSADYVIPVIRTSVATRPVARALDRLSATLTTAELQGLCAQVVVDHDDPGVVAARWLRHEHLM